MLVPQKISEKARPLFAPATPVHCDAHFKGMRSELDPLSRPSDMHGAPMLCIGHPTELRVFVTAPPDEYMPETGLNIF